MCKPRSVGIATGVAGFQIRRGHRLNDGREQPPGVRRVVASAASGELAQHGSPTARQTIIAAGKISLPVTGLEALQAGREPSFSLGTHAAAHFSRQLRTSVKCRGPAPCVGQPTPHYSERNEEPRCGTFLQTGTHGLTRDVRIAPVWSQPPAKSVDSTKTRHAFRYERQQTLCTISLGTTE